MNKDCNNCEYKTVFGSCSAAVCRKQYQIITTSTTTIPSKQPIINGYKYVIDKEQEK